MNRRSRRPLTSFARRHRGDDRGVALIVSMALVGLVTILLVVLVSVAIRESNASGRDRQRAVAVMTAEGAVDTLLSQVQEAPAGSLPCGVLTPLASSVRSDDMAVSREVTYYTAADVEIPCAQIWAGTPANTAAITSTAVTEAIQGQAEARRTVETLLQLTPVYDNDLDKAIFGDAGVSLANHADIYGENGTPNADVYTNGNVRCDNNQHYYGSIYAQGTVSMTNTCTVDVNVYAKGGFTATNPGVTVNGKIESSQGSISLGKASLGQTAQASGTATSDPGQACSTPGKCTGGQVLADPPASTFPQISWPDARAEWEAEGFTVVEVNDCTLTGDANGPGRWLMDNASTLTTDTILRTTCQLKLQPNNQTIALAKNLAVFADGGINFSNSITITSTTSDVRNFYLIQPYNAVSHPCTSAGISLDNRVTVTPLVSDLLYSPCNIYKANNSDHYGQIYGGGEVVINNRLTMYYRPVPVWGVVGSTTTVNHYTLDMLYKRETIG